MNDKYRVVEAFRIGGKVYYMFDDQYETPTGRQLAALGVYEEMNMRCTKEYLELHCRAVRRVLSDRNKIDLTVIAQLNVNLEERLQLMPLPDFVYKLASVVFFDESESPYMYDYNYAEKKIAVWKEAGGTLDFFLNTPLRELIPSLKTPQENIDMYFQVANQIDRMHQELVSGILSEKE